MDLHDVEEKVSHLSTECDISASLPLSSGPNITEKKGGGSEGNLIFTVDIQNPVTAAELSSSHQLRVTNYHKPTFCDYCNELLWGLVKQGLKCTACHRSFHKKCSYKVLMLCSHKTTSVISAIPRVPHRFLIRTFKVPTVCGVCDKLLWGAIRQGMQCEDCGFHCHRKCQVQVPDNCGFIAIKISDAAAGAPSPSESDSESGVFGSNIVLHRLLNKPMTSDIEDRREDREYDQEDSNKSVKNKGKVHCVNGHQFMATHLNVPTFCQYCNKFIWGAGKQAYKCTHCGVKCHKKCHSFMPVCDGLNKDSDDSIRLEGWFLTTNSKDNAQKKLYWRLFEENRMAAYCSSQSLKPCEILPLSKILEVDFSQIDPSTLCILTSRCKYYLVSKIGEKDVQAWIDALLASDNRISTRGKSKKGDKAKHTIIGDNIGADYILHTNDMLGSGQFGIVNSATHKASGKCVAVKQIDKRKFMGIVDATTSRRVKDELKIMRAANHPGIVCLNAVYETSNTIFIVMEKVQGGDMLDLILNSPDRCLTERIARFIIYQIMVALRYLHVNNIAHRDLKPENVLICNSSDEFPLTKLCDFGFARVVGERSFMKSLVGTPAYVAPEVIHNNDFGYNRCVDMWSLGVIVYVTLSGTFPFNENEDVREQIDRGDFLFPRNTWSSLPSAVDFITNLLTVDPSHRIDISQAFEERWINNEQLKIDIVQHLSHLE